MLRALPLPLKAMLLHPHAAGSRPAALSSAACRARSRLRRRQPLEAGGRKLRGLAHQGGWVGRGRGRCPGEVSVSAALVQDGSTTPGTSSC